MSDQSEFQFTHIINSVLVNDPAFDIERLKSQCINRSLDQHPEILRYAERITFVFRHEEMSAVL